MPCNLRLEGEDLEEGVGEVIEVDEGVGVVFFPNRWALSKGVRSISWRGWEFGEWVWRGCLRLRKVGEFCRDRLSCIA